MTSRMGVSQGRPSWTVWPCSGIITDVLGFGLLFPATRYAMQKRIMARLERSIQEGAVQVRMAEGEIFLS